MLLRKAIGAGFSKQDLALDRMSFTNILLWISSLKSSRMKINRPCTRDAPSVLRLKGRAWLVCLLPADVPAILLPPPCIGTGIRWAKQKKVCRLRKVVSATLLYISSSYQSIFQSRSGGGPVEANEPVKVVLPANMYPKQLPWWMGRPCPKCSIKKRS